jgi:hypothetical protein
LKIVIGIVVLIAMLAPLIAVASFRRKGNHRAGPPDEKDPRGPS